MSSKQGIQERTHQPHCHTCVCALPLPNREAFVNYIYTEYWEDDLVHDRFTPDPCIQVGWLV